jgi:hypothetical protein
MLIVNNINIVRLLPGSPPKDNLSPKPKAWSSPIEIVS